jgi:hypothetical protein
MLSIAVVGSMYAYPDGHFEGVKMRILTALGKRARSFEA